MKSKKILIAGEETHLSYEECIDFAREAITKKNTYEATRWVNRACALDTSRAEAYNVLGIIAEIGHNTLQAQKYYRAAIALNPTYEPAYNNLRRTTGTRERGAMDLGASFQK